MWSCPIAVCQALIRERTNRAASPCDHGLTLPLCPRVSRSHHVHLSPIILMERSLLSWPECVTFLLAVRTCWVRVGAILPFL